MDLISHFFEQLVRPGFQAEVVKELLPCFYRVVERTQDFVSVLNKVIWEYNFVNKMFMMHYKVLSNLNP